MPGYHAKKRLGQNFLKSKSIVQRILDTLDLHAGETVVEVGPGRGALTLPLAHTGVRVVAVEFDRDVIGYLTRLVRGQDNVTIVNADFLSFEPASHGIDRFKLVGNLPFNLSSPVLEWTTKRAAKIERAVFMVQKEVGERVCSSPGTKGWSPLAIFTQLAFEAHFCFEVGPEHFSPPPSVVSAVIELRPHQQERAAIPEGFETVVRAAFRQRRKLLVNNLVPEPVGDSKTMREILAELNLSENVRAEQVTIADFFNLTRSLHKRRLL